MRTWSLVCIALTVAISTACSTVGSRIKKSQELFDSYPPEVQENIRNKNIQIGYTKDMVRIAFGKPDRVYTRKTASGEATIWAYTEDNSPTVSTGFGVGFRRGNRAARIGMHHDFDDYEKYEKLRIEWDGDKVKAIEKVDRK